MALIIKGAIKVYYYLNEEIADQRTENWPLMRTPWPGIALLALYLYLVKHWLPNYMKDKPAYNLRQVIIVFNSVQIVACAYLCYQSLVLGWLNQYKLVCQPIDDSSEDGVNYAWRVCYGYFVLKLIDLLDTVFFVLRKKQSQVSFLHVYHHWGMVTVAWGMVKWVPGGHMTLLVPVNSVVHMIMYSYYLLTIWDSRFKESIWWKKYVTQIQIIQFSILLIHFITLLLASECSHPRQPVYILIPQNLFMVILFCDFYYRAYIKAPKKQKQ